MRRKARRRCLTISVRRWRKAKQQNSFFRNARQHQSLRDPLPDPQRQKPETRVARIEKFVAMLIEGKTIYPLKLGPRKKA